MTHRPPLDPRRKAFAEALGHALAEAIWREVTSAEPQNRNQGAGLVPKNDGAHQPASSQGAVEVNDESMSHTAA